MSADAKPPYRSAPGSVDWSEACAWDESLDASTYRAEVDHTVPALVVGLIAAIIVPMLAAMLLSGLGATREEIVPVSIATYLLAATGLIWRAARGAGRWRLVVTSSTIRFARGRESVTFPTHDTTADLCEVESSDNTSATVRLRHGERQSNLDMWSPVPLAKRRVERLREVIDAIRARSESGDGEGHPEAS